MARRKKGVPELNGAGTSDISFLLLCFFLMTSSMDQSKGLQRRLPPMPEEPTEQVKNDVKGRNVLTVLVDGQDRLSVNQRMIDVDMLREEVKSFILNESNDPKKPSKKEKNIPGLGNVMISEAVISLQNVRSTSYDAYIRVQSALASAYSELRENESRSRFGKSFADITERQQDQIRDIYPQRISEAEPKDTRKKK